MSVPATRYYYDGTANLNFYGDIGPGGITADDFQQALHNVRRADRVTIFIDSSGGAIEHSAAIAAAIRRAPMERHAIVVGRCHSAAVDVLAACSYRRAVEGSTMMLHACDSLDTEAVEADAEKVAMTYADRLSASCRGATRAQLDKWILMGCWFSAADMMKFGFVNSVIPATADMPLRSSTDLAGRNRPLPSEPFISYGTILETPTYDAHHKSICSAPAKRQPIELPPLPPSLVGRAILCAADLQAERDILAQPARHAPGDVRGAAEQARRKATARALLSAYADHEQSLAAIQRTK